jgi:hypothetical protein
MPFDPTTKIYTPPAGAENATAGQLIQSAIWNTIFTDMASALSALGQQTAVPPVMITATSGGVISVTQPMVIVAVSGTSTVTLPAATSTPGAVLTVKTVTTSPVISATANVVALATTVAATAILASGTAGKWSRLVASGTVWVAMGGN